MPIPNFRSSSAIERVGYNADTQCLSIWFKGGGGRRYVYADVPEELYADLCGTNSPGPYICQRVTGKVGRLHSKPRRRDD